jgi:hypothetical protein
VRRETPHGTHHLLDDAAISFLALTGHKGLLAPSGTGGICVADDAEIEGFAVYATPPMQQHRLKSTNLVEWINRELRRRARVVTIFPGEESLLRLVSAILVEMSEDWESHKKPHLPKEDLTYRPG